MCEKLDLLVCTARDLQPLTRCPVQVPSSQVFTAAPHLTPLSSTERKQKETLSRRRISCPPDTVSSVSTTQSGIAPRASLNIRLSIIPPDPDSNWKSPNIRCAARKQKRSVGVCLFASYRIHSACSKPNGEAPPCLSKPTPVQQILACSPATQ